MAIPEKLLEGKRGVEFTDALIDLCDKGGNEGPLALISLFHLMIKRNIEYPEFYTKLYSYFTEETFYAKYRQKFIHWANIFLSSTHVSSILIAAFIKKASRLALKVDSNVALSLVKLVGNMLIRHPSLSHLRHKDVFSTDIDQDPYDPCEPDPLKSNAMESSLWELKTLESHWHPKISSISRRVMRQKYLPEAEWPIDEEEKIDDCSLREELLSGVPIDEKMNLDDNYKIEDVFCW